MKLTTRVLTAGGGLLALILAAPLSARQPEKLPAAPKGFDKKRDDIPRGMRGCTLAKTHDALGFRRVNRQFDQ